MLNKTRQGFGTSVAHGQIQCYLKKQIPRLEIEKMIGPRRADAVWEEKKIVFEIQLSPITFREAQARCADYSAAGYETVWILHEAIFNGRTLSPAEQFLRTVRPTYFTNGREIYDQIEVVGGRRRLYKGASLPIEISEPCSPFLKIPARSWPLHFVGDLHTLCAREGVDVVTQTIRKQMPPQGFRGWVQWIGFRILELVSTNQK